jgi:MOSC domain-containing protein YiiM
MSADAWRIEAVLTGRAMPLRGDESSAIGKQRREGCVRVTALGLAGDEQADRANHGGPDMAVHLYPRDHYHALAARTPDPLLGAAGALGENISVRGLIETDVAIGDRFRMGSALVEIAQGRKPCWKPAHRLGDPGLVAHLVASGTTGWYFRVLEDGTVGEGDALIRVERPHAGWSVARVFGLIVRGDRDDAALRELEALPALSADWRRRAGQRLRA